jgi:hypothetical protein
MELEKGGGTPPMRNSPGIPLAALVVAIVLSTITMLSVIAQVGRGAALNELQIGATAWALALTCCCPVDAPSSMRPRA